MWFSEQIDYFSKQYHSIKNNKEQAGSSLPGQTYFLENNNILCIPRDDGDSRYPYGTDGYNFWAYSSGYMHCNDGLFSIFLRAAEGQEPKIAFFAGLPDRKGEYFRIPLLPVPRTDDENFFDIQRYTVFTPCSAYYISEFADMRFAIRVFISSDRKISFTCNVKNLSADVKKIYISSYFNPSLEHKLHETGESRWFKEVRVLKPADGQQLLGSFIIRQNEDIDRTTSRSNYAIIHRKMTSGANSTLTAHQETASRNQYVGGSRSSLHTAAALKKGTFDRPKHLCTFTEIAIAGDLLHLEIGSKDEIRIDMQFICCFDDQEKDLYLAETIDPRQIDEDLELQEQNEKAKQEAMTVTVGEAREKTIKKQVFNSFFVHLKKQVEFCSVIKGYVQLYENSLIGIRDIFQAIEGLIFWQPGTGRNKMLEALNYIAPDGRCPRQYSLPYSDSDSPVMDLRPFIDQGVWVISTIVTYLRVTGDFEFLDETCGYYEIVDEKRKMVKKSLLRESVLEHMFRITDYLISNIDFEKTYCVRALYGDWNDALDGLGVSMDAGREYGSGVSVMVSLQVYQNLKEMIELLGKLDTSSYMDRISRYRGIADGILSGLKKYAIVVNGSGEERIVHGWGDRRSYLVGSFKDPDGLSRTGLTSHAFWVLSGAYDTDTRLYKSIIKAFENLDSRYGLKTFEPPFAPNTPGVGRIPKLPAGTAENGAAYVHASAFGIMALFRLGDSEEAWGQLCKSLPFTHDRVSCSPYIMPNSYCFNEEKNIDGESMLDWQTGSSNVILKSLIRFVFGIEPHFDGVFIQPAAYLPFESFEFSIMLRSTRFIIKYEKLNEGKRTFKINGTECTGTRDSAMRLDKLWITWDRLTEDDLYITVID